MTNHNYLHIKDISLKQIKEDIDEINLQRFYGKLNIKYLKAPNGWEKETDVIYISLKTCDLGMWFNEEEVLEIRNQGYNGFTWIGYIIETELSVKYNAFKGSEGVGDEKWKGDLTKWNTYADYLLMLNTKKNWWKLRRAKKRAKEQAEYYDCKAFTD